VLKIPISKEIVRILFGGPPYSEIYSYKPSVFPQQSTMLFLQVTISIYEQLNLFLLIAVGNFPPEYRCLKPRKTSLLNKSQERMIQTHSLIPGNKDHKVGVVLTHTFRKKEHHWFIDLPGYLEQGFTESDLEMVQGAQRLLDLMAGPRKKITLNLGTEPFEGADRLELMEHCEAPRGGAIYLLDTCRGKERGDLIWICDIALFVFGDMPPYIYVKQCPDQ
jgi:hypothetical protein